jgi:hypothetical protein
MLEGLILTRISHRNHFEESVWGISSARGHVGYRPDLLTCFAGCWPFEGLFAGARERGLPALVFVADY